MENVLTDGNAATASSLNESVTSTSAVSPPCTVTELGETAIWAPWLAPLKEVAMS